MFNSSLAVKEIDKNLKNDNFFERINNEDLQLSIDAEQAIWHIKQTHNNDKYIIFNAMGNNGKMHQWGFSSKELTEDVIKKIINLSITENYNVYVSQANYFNALSRTKSNLWNISTLIVDIDYYKISEYKDLPAENIVKLMELDGLFNKIPKPSYLIDSGNGLYLVYLLNSVPLKSFYGNIKLWELVSKALVNQLADYAADIKATDVTRINRLPVTVNYKTNRQVNIINFEQIKDKHIQRYNLSDLADMLLPYSHSEVVVYKQKKEDKEKKKLEQIKKKNAKVRSLNNIYKLNYSRMKDIETLIELRSSNCEGTRELMLFLYALFAFDYIKDENKVLNELIRLNNTFISSLSIKEVEHAFESAKKNVDKYKYKNETLINLLQITKEEMKCLLTLIDDKEKLERQKAKRKQERRNENNLTSREQQKINKLFAIQRMLKRNLTQAEIAKKLKISNNRVSELIKEIKNL